MLLHCQLSRWEYFLCELKSSSRTSLEVHKRVASNYFSKRKSMGLTQFNDWESFGLSAEKASATKSRWRSTAHRRHILDFTLTDRLVLDIPVCFVTQSRARLNGSDL